MIPSAFPDGFTRGDPVAPPADAAWGLPLGVALIVVLLGVLVWAWRRADAARADAARADASRAETGGGASRPSKQRAGNYLLVVVAIALICFDVAYLSSAASRWPADDTTSSRWGYAGTATVSWVKSSNRGSPRFDVVLRDGTTARIAGLEADDVAGAQPGARPGATLWPGERIRLSVECEAVRAGAFGWGEGYESRACAWVPGAR